MLSELLLSHIFVGLALAKPFLDINLAAGGSQIFEQFPSISSACSRDGQQSCQNSSVVDDLCCFESPGGLLLQTQFWDTKPSTGPSNSWTIHGLWPDNCDATFNENCDPSRAYTGIGSLLSANGASDTLSFMDTFWVDIKGQNERFWEHEWATHGTCLSTLDPSCLPSESDRGAEAVAFFQTVVKLFQTLPTYTWLENEGITPSRTRTFTHEELTSALQTQSGFMPALDCTGSSLNQIEWYFNLKGSVIDGTFVPVDAPKAGSCPSSGIKYPPKSGRPTTLSPPTTPTETPGDLPTQAKIHALQSGSFIGGLSSLGTWSTQNLATVTLSGTTDSFTMTSSRGNCGVSRGSFSCGSGVALTSFSAVSSGGTLFLAYGGSTAFSSDGVPGATALKVFTDSKHAQEYTLFIV